MRFAGFALMFLGILIAYSLNSKLKKKLQEINEQIQWELPRFIRTYNNSKTENTQILTVIENYRKVCGKAFAYDLDVLITDLQTMGEEEALTRFDERVNIGTLSQFISAVISTTKGINQDVYFSGLSREMSVMAHENIKREIEKRPGKVKAYTMITACMIFGIILYPLIIQTIDSLSEMF